MTVNADAIGNTSSASIPLILTERRRSDDTDGGIVIMIEGILRKTDDLIVRKYRELFVPTLLSSFSYYLGNILNGVIVGNLLGLDKMAAVYILQGWLDSIRN